MPGSPRPRSGTSPTCGGGPGTARRALITSLHAPSTEPDALGWLLKHLETAGASKLTPIADLVAELREIHALLEQHNQALADQSRAIRADVAARMRRLARTPRHPVAVDLRLDASIVLPGDIAREAERATLVLARVSAHPYAHPRGATTTGCRCAW